MFQVDLYVEGLCPYCRELIMHTVNYAYEEGLFPFMEFNTYYSGKNNVLLMPFDWYQAMHISEMANSIANTVTMNAT